MMKALGCACNTEDMGNNINFVLSLLVLGLVPVLRALSVPAYSLHVDDWFLAKEQCLTVSTNHNVVCSRSFSAYAGSGAF